MNANGRAQYRSLRVRISQQKFDSFLSLLCRGLFRLSGSLGNGEREIKRAGAGEKGKEFSIFSPFSRRFPTGGVSAEERGFFQSPRPKRI